LADHVESLANSCERRDIMLFERVILHATEGSMKGQDFVLENGTNCILGRDLDCLPCLTDPLSLISRHHCRIKVYAPLIRIQDLGSRNGTYVNGEMIGQRSSGQTLEEALREEHTEQPLWQGDRLRLGNTVFEVELDPPPPCAEVQARDQQKLWSGGCAACR
jgi:pSer/pThr/pTyr-binding forkhead associated (FHA) protein